MNDADKQSSDRPTKEDSDSIYPDLIPWEKDHPTFSHFEVVGTEDPRGRGLRARVIFQPGQLVARISGIITNRTTLDTMQVSPPLHFMDPWFCRFLLHSCNPNIAIDIDLLEARATRVIHPGDYLAFDYATTEDFIARQFACHCGAPQCRGWITGRREKPNEEGLAILSQNRKSRL